MKKNQFQYDYFLLILVFIGVSLVNYTQGRDQPIFWITLYNFIYGLLSYACIKSLNKITLSPNIIFITAFVLCFIPFMLDIVFSASIWRFDKQEWRLIDTLMNIVKGAFFAPTVSVLYFSIQAKRKFEIDDGGREVKEDTEDDIFLLGQSDAGEYNSLNAVIKSLLRRANSSLKMTTTSLVIMITIVFIGGSASIGTVALNDLNSVRSLEKDREKLLQLRDLLASRLHETKDSSIIESNNRIITFFKFEFYDENGVLQKIGRQETATSFNWQDIAMKVTIAALTLFLVQIFFQIYKYNQRQAAQLLTRAETLELFKTEDANSDELRTSLLSKLPSDSNFDKSPSSPTEQIINVIEKATSK